MQTTFYPRHPLKLLGWPAGSPAPRRHLAKATSHLGDWHYMGLPKPARIPWLAALFSAGLHALLLWGGGARLAPRPVAVVPDEPVIQMVMPPLADEKEPPVEELENQLDQDPGVQVPQLADLPSAVDLSNVFVQPLDLSVPLQTSLDASKMTSIPLKIAPAGHRPSGLKDLFDLAQLDRVPEPIVQPPPEFPYQLKKVVDQAEVVVEFIVDSRGETRDIRVRSSTHAGFEQPSIDGVSKWRFRPGLKGGRKVNTRMMIPIRFTVMPDE